MTQTQETDKDNNKCKHKAQRKSPHAEKEAELAGKIAALEAELAELKDKHLRTIADYDNFRKRSFRELSDARMGARMDTLIPILNVFDHFRLAVSAAESAADMNSIRDGMKMISAELGKALADLGVEELDATGQKFDPEIHEAVAHESSDIEEGTITKQWRCGYKLAGKILRPANVVVSSGPAPAPEGQANA